MRDKIISGGGCIWNDILDKDIDCKVGTCFKEENRLVDQYLDRRANQTSSCGGRSNKRISGSRISSGPHRPLGSNDMVYFPDGVIQFFLLHTGVLLKI